MNHLVNCCMLLFYCFCSLSLSPADAGFVAAFFTAVTAASLLYLLPGAAYRICAASAFAAALFRFPQLCLFLPLVVYFFYLPESGGGKCRLFALLPAVLSVAGTLRAARFSEDPARLLFIGAGCGFALLLRLRTDSRDALYARYLQTHDSDTEVNLLLREKNQSLLEKQDYEIYAATLRERNRIAREIHDNVGHMLTRSILMVGALKTINKDAAAAEPLSKLDETLNQAMDSIRKSVHDLHDRSVDLNDSLRVLLRDFLFCPVTLQYDMSADAPAPVKYCFIAVVKEALVNISRHSRATAAWVRVQEHPAFYQLSIRDNGQDAAGPVKPDDGIGLANMQNRVAALHGAMQISSDGGFCIFITIPKQQKEAQHEYFTG